MGKLLGKTPTRPNQAATSPLPARHWERIAAAWRERLGKEPWTPGTRLPPNSEIAREFGVSTSRAQQALLSLKREGLLERAPGRGTIVSEAAADAAGRQAAGRNCAARANGSSGIASPLPQRVGILLNVAGPVSPYAVRLAHLLCEELDRRGVDARLRVFHPERADAPERLAADVRDTGFGALFVLGNMEPRERIAALRLPVPLLGHGPLRYVAYAPDLTLWDEIAAVLVKAGVKRPAFATNLRPEVAAMGFAADGLRDLPDKDLDGIWAARFRLALHNHGIHPDLSRLAYALPDDPGRRDAASLGRSAHDAVRRLLAASPRPDALVVHPDELVPGAVAAILESGLRVPGDLVCVFHCNRDMEPYVPFPCLWIAHDPAEEAVRWAGNIEALLRGGTLPAELSAHLIRPLRDCQASSPRNFA